MDHLAVVDVTVDSFNTTWFALCNVQEVPSQQTTNGCFDIINGGFHWAVTLTPDELFVHSICLLYPVLVYFVGVAPIALVADGLVPCKYVTQ
jgi:hypothetical protein